MALICIHQLVDPLNICRAYSSCVMSSCNLCPDQVLVWHHNVVTWCDYPFMVLQLWYGYFTDKINYCLKWIKHAILNWTCMFIIKISYFKSINTTYTRCSKDPTTILRFTLQKLTARIKHIIECTRYRNNRNKCVQNIYEIQ